MHERGLRVYTTLNVDMQRAADRAVRDGLHAYDRRHGWRGNLPNILKDHRATLDTYDDDDWHGPIQKGDYVDGLVLTVDGKTATVKIGPYRAVLTRAGLCLDHAPRRERNPEARRRHAVFDPRHRRQHCQG